MGNVTVELFAAGSYESLRKESGHSEFEMTNLPWGNYTLTLSAPNFIPRTINITVAPHETTEVGDVVLTAESASTVGIAVAALYGLLAGLGIVTLVYYAMIKRKWSRPRKPFDPSKEKADRREESPDRVERLGPGG